MLVSRKTCMGGLDLFLGFLPVDLRQIQIEDGLHQRLPVHWRFKIGFPDGAANQLRYGSLPSPRQSAQLLEFFRVHQKLRPSGGQHLALLYAHTDVHEYTRPPRAWSIGLQKQWQWTSGTIRCPKPEEQ